MVGAGLLLHIDKEVLISVQGWLTVCRRIDCMGVVLS